MNLVELIDILKESINFLDEENISLSDCEIVISCSKFSKVELRLNNQHSVAQLVFYYKK